MEDITIALLERIGLLLIAAFIVSRIHSFKNLIYREYNWKTVVLYSVLFGLFSIAGTTSGVTISDGELIRSLFVSFLAEGDGLAHSGIMGIIMGGLLGGPVVGLGAGLIAGIHFGVIGGLSGTAYAASAPFIGLLAGATARFFSEEKVISPAKSFFIGMFAIILCMCSILIFTRPHDEAVHLVNMIGIPMVVANSGAIAIFTAMIRIVLNEKEHAQAMETRRALNLAQKVLPYLKQGLNPHTAKQTAQLMMNELEPAAVAVTDCPLAADQIPWLPARGVRFCDAPYDPKGGVDFVGSMLRRADQPRAFPQGIPLAPHRALGRR
jgi:two-component system, LytTR family, sensor histidine kinase LytS